jgi:subtilase family serine protease
MTSNFGAGLSRGPDDWFAVAGNSVATYIFVAFTDYMWGPATEPAILTRVFGTPSEVGFDPGAGVHPTASLLHANPDIPLLAYQQNWPDGSNSIMFARRDAPDVWPPVYAIVGGSGGQPSENKTPELAVDSLNHIHLAYVRTSAGEPGAVYYLRNLNQGDNNSWEPQPGRRLSWTVPTAHDIVIAASHDGNTILVLWTSTNAMGNDDLAYAYSINGGDTFSPALNLSATVYNEGYPAVFVDPDTSTFHVAFWRNDSMPTRTNNVLYAQASWADPANWTTPQSILDVGSVVSSVYRRPAIAAYTYQNNHTAVVGWTDARSSPNLDLYTTNVSLINCNITANPRSGPVPLNVLFSASASGGTAPYTYTWRLGDGAMGGGPFGAHVYNTAGDYNVAMRVDDAVGNTCFRAVRIRALQIIPDLSVSPSDISFSPPPPQVEGTVIQVNATIRNVGGADSVATNARLFDGVPPSPQIGTDQTLPPIPLNGSANVSVMWIASPPGDHETCIVADPDNLVTEIDETNNMACAPFKVLSIPDLAPISMSVTPPSPLLEGTLARVDATIANRGDLPAGAFNVLLFDDRNSDMRPEAGENISLSPLPGVAGHSQENASFTWASSLVGNHALCAYADPPPGMVVESNETNNVICIDVLVQPGPILRPDYVPVSPLPLPPIIAGMSTPVSLSIQVLNQGNATATDVATVAFHEPSSPPFSTFVLNPLAPAATSSRFTATWTSPAIPGVYSVFADVDYLDNVSEWDETNNIYEWIIHVTVSINTTLAVGTPNYTAIHTYVNSLTPLSFSAVSYTGSPIAYTEYRIDVGSWTNYIGPFTLVDDGAHLIEYRSADTLGSVEAIRSSFLVVDNTAPPSQLQVGDPSHVAGDTWITSDTPLSIQVIDNVTGNASYVSDWRDLTVYEDKINDMEAFSAYLARVNLTITREIWPGLRSVTFHIESMMCNDIDIGVFRDKNGDGVRQVTELVGYGAGPTSDETVVLSNPLPGSYIIAIAGYDVPQPTGCLIDLGIAQDIGGVASVGYIGVKYRVWSEGAWSGWADYLSQFKVQGEGHAYIERYAYDILGNFGSVQNDTLHVDNTPPISTISIGNPNYTVGGNFVSFSTLLALQAVDMGITPVGVGQILYRVDGRAWNVYTSPISFVNEGLHTVESRAKDFLMNAEDIRSIQVIVDNTPPTASCAVGLPKHSSDELYVRSSSPFNLTASDGGTIPVGVGVVRYRVDDSNWSNYSSDFSLTGIDGLHTIEYMARDLLGNEQMPWTQTVFLDNTPPLSTLDPGSGEYTTETLFRLTVADSGSGVQLAEYAVDGGEWIWYPADFVLSKGTHTISYRSRDYLNNTEPEREQIVTVRGQSQPEGGANYKPLVAAVFAIILAVIGLWSSKRRPWKGGKDKMAVTKAFIIFSLPFVLAEAATGIASYVTGQLSIPPALGSGTAVDLGVLVAGLVVVLARVLKKREMEAESTNEPENR